MGVDATVLEERGCAFVAGEAFYRPESAQARDLAILAVMAHQQRSGSRMRVLDCCSGSGVRGARYLQQAGVESVWCNDYNTGNRALMVANLLGDPHRALRHAPAGMEEVGEEASFPGLRGAVLQGAVDACEQRGGAPQRWRVSHFEARRLLTACWLAEDYYDFVDVDCFGAQGALTGAALGAVRHGGLLYLTCTDGLGASGRAPLQSLVQYGCFTQPTAFANEQGLRMMIASTVLEAAKRGLTARPLFSLFSAHGPVFRVMFRVTRGNDRRQLADINFISHSAAQGESGIVAFSELGGAASRKAGEPLGGGGAGGSDACQVCGPLWSGALHCSQALEGMRQQAEALGWLGHAVDSASWAATLAGGSPKYKRWRLEELLAIMAEEAAPGLLPWHILVGEVSRVGRLRGTPGRDKLIDALRADGHLAARCHITPRALYTSASMSQVVDTARRHLEPAPAISRQREGAPADAGARKPAEAEASGGRPADGPLRRAVAWLAGFFR